MNTGEREGEPESPGIPAKLRDALSGRYPVERSIGRGGMATVYLARDVKHSRRVAIKVLHPELAAGLGTERFLREIQIEANLQHPHILPLHDSGEADGFLYYVMPYVSGESLRERLTREGRLPVDDALHIAAQVADAVGHAHEQGVVHRDIKPENILLTGGHALVADFGIAKAVEIAGASKLTQTGWGMGTPAYMSPEQIMGEAVDARSDIYGLGCLLYEMLAGAPPFTGPTARAVFAHHQLDPAPRLREVRPDAPEQVEQAVLTALAKHPAERFATAGQLVEALRTPGSRPAGSRPTRVSEGAGIASRLRRRPAVVGVASVCVLAAAAYVAGFQVSRSSGTARAASVAVVPIDDLSGDTSQAYVADGITDQLITDLAQTGALEVINRRKMMTYRGSARTAREIAGELQADAVLTGTMQRLGDTVHMTAQLTLAGEERALWAQSYQGTRGDLLRIQREIARAVVQRIRGALTPAQQAGLASSRMLDPAALDLYMKGRYWWNRRGPGLLQSIELFTQALDLDPTFALAYSGMADAYVQLGYGGFLAPSDAFPKARAAAERALSLDSTLAEPHAALGFVAFYYDWNWAKADRAFQRALAANPGYATGHEWYGLYLTAMGRYEEAIAHERRAQELDPLSAAVAGTAAWVLHYSGRNDDAARELKVALRVDTGFALGHLYLGRVYQAMGKFDSALGEYASTGPLRGWIANLAGEGFVYGAQGREREARSVLARMDSMSQREYVSAYAVATVHTGLGNRDSAFAWLERGVRERTHWLVWLNRDPRWKTLRPDPRFAALVRQIGLPP